MQRHTGAKAVPASRHFQALDFRLSPIDISGMWTGASSIPTPCNFQPHVLPLCPIAIRPCCTLNKYKKSVKPIAKWDRGRVSGGVQWDAHTYKKTHHETTQTQNHPSQNNPSWNDSKWPGPQNWPELKRTHHETSHVIKWPKCSKNLVTDMIFITFFCGTFRDRSICSVGCFENIDYHDISNEMLL